MDFLPTEIENVVTEPTIFKPTGYMELKNAIDDWGRDKIAAEKNTVIYPFGIRLLSTLCTDFSEEGKVSMRTLGVGMYPM